MTPAAVGTPQGPSRPRWGAAVTAGALVVVAGTFGWLIYRDVHGVIGLTAFEWALLFAFVPVLPMCAVFAWLDRLRPEPARLLVVALAWGALVATYASLHINGWLAREIGDVYGATPRSAVFIAPWVEEATKAAIVFAIVWWRRHDFNAVAAGVVYGGLAGIGFAFTENIVYYGQLFEGTRRAGGDSTTALDAVQDLFLWRGVAAPFVHPMFTVATGIGIGIAVRYRHAGVRILAPVAGYCTAVVLHMGYNTIASFAADEALRAVYIAILVPTLLTLVALVVAVRRHERRVVAARLRDYTAFGWLREDAIDFIVSRSGRRRARRYARPFGKQERRRVKQFQRAGVELGILRDRLVRGVVGPSALPRERELIDTVRRLRGRVMLPLDDRMGEELSAVGSSW